MRALLMLALAACTDDVTVVRVTLDARATVPPVTTLVVTATAGDQRMVDARLGQSSVIPFPTAFTLTPSRGPLSLRVVAYDAAGIPLGRAAGGTTALADTLVDVGLRLDPDDFVASRDFSQSYTALTNDRGYAGRQLAAAPGGYVAVWASGAPCFSVAACQPRARFLDAKLAGGGELPLAPAPVVNPTVAIGVGSGGIFAAWDTPTGGAAFRVFGAIVAGPATVMTPVVVAADTSYDDRRPSVVPLADGRFVLLYERSPGSNPGMVLARLLAPDLVALSFPAGVTLTVGPKNGSREARGVGLAAGGFAVLLVENDDTVNSSQLRLRSFDASLQPAIDVQFEALTANRLVGPAIAEAQDGSLVLAWHEQMSTGGGWTLQVVRVSKTGVLGMTRSRPQLGGAEVAAPALALRGDGAIAVAWTATDGITSDVRLRLLHPNGLPSGPDILVNTITGADQRYPSMVAAADGGLLLVWQDTSQAPPDTVSPAIRAREIYPTLAHNDGQIGADCGGPADAPCLPSLTCASDGAGVPTRCHAACSLPDGTDCPSGGQCRAGACVYDP